MPSISKTVLPAIAVIAMVQYCPAPFLAAIPAAVAVGLGAVSSVVAATASVAGVVTSAIIKREEGADELTGEVNPEFYSRIKRLDFGLGTAWQDCHNQLAGAHVVFSGPSPGTVLVKGIPSACMTLSTVITGNFNAGNPVPMGSDSISFTNLSNAEIMTIQNALDAR